MNNISDFRKIEKKRVKRLAKELFPILAKGIIVVIKQKGTKEDFIMCCEVLWNECPLTKEYANENDSSTS